jgi:hypothetical protein
MSLYLLSWHPAAVVPPIAFLRQLVNVNTVFFPALQKDYAFAYDVNELDEYGNPNVHSRTEVREGPHVKGTTICPF